MSDVKHNCPGVLEVDMKETTIKTENIEPKPEEIKPKPEEVEPKLEEAKPEEGSVADKIVAAFRNAADGSVTKFYSKTYE